MKDRIPLCAIGLIILLTLSVVGGVKAQGGSGWHIEIVEAGDPPDNRVGEHTSLAIDSAGHPHISYYHSTLAALRYAYHDGTTWHIETVEIAGDVGRFTSLALDNADHPHISYCLYTPNRWYCDDLKYAYHDGSTWYTETVDSVGRVGNYTSLALNAAGRPYILYYDYTNKVLKYAYRNDSGWQIESLGFRSADISLALDAAGHPHISYHGGGGLSYTRFDGSAWQTELVDRGTSMGEHCSLDLDVAGHPHISYRDGFNDDLKYAHYDGAGWQIETVDSGRERGKHSSLALDAIGRPHISYCQSSGITAGYCDDLLYAYYDGTRWRTEVVDTGEGDDSVGEDASLALDIAGRPYISYYDVSKGSLKLAYRLTAEALPETGGWPGLVGIVIVAAMLVVLGQMMRHGATLHQ